MDSFWKVVGVLVVLVFVIFVASQVSHHHKHEIEKWCQQEGCVLLDHETCVFDKGPYWYVGEDDYVYKIRVKDQSEQEFDGYVHFGLFGMEAELNR